jgi:ribosomal protein S3
MTATAPITANAPHTCVAMVERPDGSTSVNIDGERPVVCVGLRAERVRELMRKAVAIARAAP